ncbi:glycosyltransferase [Jeotgalibaca sp. A122]|uniref:glycosyltransferase n=1 Tax=Jeotgalibaca sp. A122 TaxID=3457322 RepID=UPI003FD68587
MRILIYGVSNNYGGIETFFLNLIKRINPAEIQFDFITSSEEPCSYEKEITDVGGENFSIIPWGKQPKEHIAAVKKIVQGNNYDYVWINTASASKVGVYEQIKAASSATIIIHSHGASFESKRKGIKRFVLKSMHLLNKRKLAKVADIKFATSKEAANWLFGDEWSSNTCYFIKNGIDSMRFTFDAEKRQKIRNDLALSDQLVLGHVGRLAEVKNQSFLLDILKEIQLKHRNSKLMLIGSGPLEEQLKKEAEAKGIASDVLFLGYQEDAAPYLSAMDAFLLPSISEGLPISAVEAQAADLPCFLSDTITKEVAIIEDVVFLSIRESPEKWVDSILQRAQGRLRKNQAAVFEAKRFNIQNTVESIEEILKTNNQKDY